MIVDHLGVYALKAQILFTVFAGLAYGAVRLLHPRSPTLRRNLLMLPFAAPLMTLLALVVSPHWRILPRIVPTDLARGVAHFLAPRGVHVMNLVLVGLAVLAIGFASVMLLLRLLAVRRVLSRTKTMSGSTTSYIRTVGTDLANRYGVAPPEYRVLTQNDRPEIWLYGWHRPLIAVSRGLIAALTREEWRCVLAHELAHAAQGDGFCGQILMFLRDLLCWNPVAWLLHRLVVRERELAADATAAALLGSGEGLALVLLKVARLQCRWRNQRRFAAAFAPGMQLTASDESQMRERVHALALHTPAKTEGGWWTSAVCSTLCVAGLLASMVIAQVIGCTV